jgi:hypothetical protein
VSNDDNGNKTIIIKNYIGENIRGEKAKYVTITNLDAIHDPVLPITVIVILKYHHHKPIYLS